MSRRVSAAFLAAGSLLLAGCETLGYYGQAISGQLHILSSRRAISTLIAAPGTEPQLRARLQNVESMRVFARDELQLPLGRQFSGYVDLGRPYVVWNVFAAPEFSLEPLTWCFPVAGCVAYRGYFNESRARTYAEGLQAQGNDVYVGGVTAYSTLGWFADPVLNTVLQREPWQLASLIFHELAHQVVYLPGDTTFNESFATLVEQVGLARWLRATQESGQADAMLEQVEQDLLRREQFVALVQRTVAELRLLYASGAEHARLRALKQHRLEQLRDEYAALKQAWGGFAGYDAWFAQPLNNAQLLTVATYNAQVPGFRRVLDSCAQDLSCFYAEARRLAALPAELRSAALAAP